MLNKVTHKIALGFTLLVLFIMVVGSGGLWGTDQLNSKLNDIAENSLPTAVSSFNQMVALQGANIALLNVLADSSNDNTGRTAEQENFNSQIQTFSDQLAQLEPLVQQDIELTELLSQSQQSQIAFAAAAGQAMQLHDDNLKMKLRVLQKESRFRRQTNSLTTWGQQYLSRNDGGDGPGHARALMRTLNGYLDQLILFKQSGDFPALEKALADKTGALTDTWEKFKQADPKANRLKVLIRDIDEQLYGKAGLVALMRSSWETENNLATQMANTRQLLNQAQSAANNFIGKTLSQAEQAKSEGMSANEISRNIISVLLVGATLLAIIIAVITVRTISRPLNEMLANLSRFADGDMRVEFDCSRKDEFGQLSSAMNHTVEKLSTLLRQIAEGAENLSTVAERNAVISRQTTSAMGSQSEQLELTASAATQMEATVNEVYTHAQTTLDAIQSCEELSQDVDKHVQRTLGSIEQQSNDISSAMNHSDQLEKYSKEIGSILDTIGDIAEQTNLLALNAAIEAARAGDHGRGFAVVADEVRGLASRTQNSTQEIQDMVENMQRSIRQVVEVMQQSKHQSQQCVEHASTSQSALNDMNSSIANIRSMSSHIAEAATQQNQAVEEVSHTLEQINAVAGETSDGARNVSASSDDLLGIAQQQKELIAKFQV